MQYLEGSIYVIYVMSRIKPHFWFSSSMSCNVMISFCMSEMAFRCDEMILYSASSSLSLAPGFVSAFKRSLSLFSATNKPRIRHDIYRLTMSFFIFPPFNYGCQLSRLNLQRAFRKLSWLKDSIKPCDQRGP